MNNELEEPSTSKKIKLEKTKKSCHYGEQCERKNPIHLLKYQHSHLEEILIKFNGDLTQASKYKFKNPDIVQIQLRLYKQLQEYEIFNRNDFKRNSVIIKYNSGQTKFTTINEKIEASSPYRCFLTMIYSSKETYDEPLSISFHHLLDKSLGELDCSLHLTFSIEIEWLMDIYKAQGVSDTSMLIIYGVEDEEMLPENLPSNIHTLFVTPRYEYGTHHTKMSIFAYKDKSVRVVISTANLESSDWENRTQGLWISPKCPFIEQSKSASGESPTHFKADLIQFLLAYEKEELQIWINRILNCDFSKINVFLIASIPGEHIKSSIVKWGHRRLGNLLNRHAYQDPQDPSLIITQCSSIGSLGSNANSWLCGEFLRSLSECSNNGDAEKILPNPQIYLIYPTVSNVRGSYDKLNGGLCLPYLRQTHVKQLWLDKYLHQWKSESRHRSRAMPHIKTYARYNKSYDKMSWFVLTSANLSKAAWGHLQGSPIDCKVQLRILSYECGVLFLPKFINNSKYFNARDSLPIPYDIPLTKFQIDDHVWICDMFYKDI